MCLLLLAVWRWNRSLSPGHAPSLLVQEKPTEPLRLESLERRFSGNLVRAFLYAATLRDLTPPSPATASLCNVAPPARSVPPRRAPKATFRQALKHQAFG